MDLCKWVPRFIVFVFVCIIAWWIFVGIVAFKSVDYVSKNGLKSLVNQIWEGKK